MRVVVDTNVLVSALILTHGRVGPVLLRLRDGANLIVSGDQDLLALHPFAGIPILRPADFLEMLEDAE